MQVLVTVDVRDVSSVLSALEAGGITVLRDIPVVPLRNGEAVIACEVPDGREEWVRQCPGVIAVFSAPEFVPVENWTAFVKVRPEAQRAVQEALHEGGVEINRVKYRGAWGFTVLCVYAPASMKDWILTIPGVVGVYEDVRMETFDGHPPMESGGPVPQQSHCDGSCESYDSMRQGPLEGCDEPERELLPPLVGCEEEEDEDD